uniref:Exocyst subunit Exo70 family protein n=1 Tax=Kalanchoe fedtschenkoi TaxID=63787 RepID=A0A7N0ZTC5_KALFE
MGLSGNDDALEKLKSARNLLKNSLERSKALGFAVERVGPNLNEIAQRLPHLEAAVRPIRANREALMEVGDHINRAVTPAASVLKVYDAIHGLEKSLLGDPRIDLSGYLAVLTRLEEALKFLKDNIGFAIQWLEDIVEYLGDNAVADEGYLASLKSSLKKLSQLQKDGDRSHLDDGLLDAALDKLENEFRRLLTEHSVPLAMSSTSPSEGTQACIAPSPLPVQVIQKLQAILERLIANERLEKCIAIYVEVRGSNVRASLQALNLDYLGMSLADFPDVQSISSYIALWGKHLEFAVKHLFEAEYVLCNEVFERIGLEVWMDCFAKIAAQAGMIAFLQFGKTVTDSKKDPIKLLKLLDIFSSLNKLRLDFNRLFGGKACTDIQNMTRDLIKRVIDGAAELFWELMVQVGIQREAPPPPDGSVPRLVSFMTDYCNTLIGDLYRPLLTQVLVIHRSWLKETFKERVLIESVVNIIKAIDQNLETWSKGYDDVTLSYLFLMNNHWYLARHLRGTKIGELLGESWLREHEQYKDYYSAIFLKETWAKLPSLLSREGVILFSGGRATARDLVKKRLKAFNEAFDNMYEKQSFWVILDSDLRETTCLAIVQTMLPVYRSYMQNYGPLVEQEANASKYAKYSVQALEKMLYALFQPKPARYGSMRSSSSRQFSGKFSYGYGSSPIGTASSA